MKITIRNVDALSLSTDAIVVPVFQDIKKTEGALAKIDKALGNKITELIKNKSITGKEGELVSIFSLGKLKAQVVICAGVGKRNDFIWFIC